MVKTLLEFLNFMFELTPLLFVLALYTPLTIYLANSIKKHASVYYWVIGILSSLAFIPMLFRFMGIDLGINLRAVPILGSITNELGDFLYFSHPIIIIVMYIGALSTKNKYVAKLMSIRSELSIIVGWAIFVHTLKRFFGAFFELLEYYTDNEAFMQAMNNSPKYGGIPVSELSMSITAFTLGIVGFVLTILFIILWVTSFRWIRKKMAQKTWKKIQRWSYLFYALMFVQAMGLQLSSLINYYHKQDYLASQAQTQSVQRMAKSVNSEAKRQRPANDQSAKGQQAQTNTQANKQKQNYKRTPMFSFSKVEVPKDIKAYINMFILVAIYGSYMFLRIRKALKNRAKKASRALAKSV